MKRRTGEAKQNAMARTIDSLAKYDQFKEEVLPILHQAIRDGWTAEQIYKKVEAYAAARAVTIALTADNSTALAGVKELLDRSGGKSVERKEIKTQLSAMSDEEIDAYLAATQKESLDELKN